MMFKTRLASGLSRGRKREKGQSLVEFALVFPIFWAVLIGFIEFAFMFNAVLTVSSASRNASVIASEAADTSTADCSILQSIEADISAPAERSKIQKVDIYWTDANGVSTSNPWKAVTTYTRSSSASISCVVNGSSFAVPYVHATAGYDYAARCPTRSGCVLNGVTHTGLDTIGIKITYLYNYHTPYGALMSAGMTMERASEIRMEPFQ